MAENESQNVVVPLAGPSSSHMGAAEAAPEAAGGPHINETPVNSAKYQAPKFAADIAPLKKLPFKITPGRIAVGVIVVLLILIVVIGSVAIYAFTNGPVNVTVNVPATTPTSTSTTPSTTDQTPATTTVTSADVYVYLVAMAPDFTGGKITAADLPVGSIAIPGTGDYLVPYLSTPKYTSTDLIQKALNDLLAFKQEKVTSTKFRTELLGSDITVDVVKDAAGSTKVNFKGTWPATTSGQTVNYAKQQVERTIQKYTYNYTVTLNSSEAAYNCIDSGDVSCKQ